MTGAAGRVGDGDLEGLELTYGADATSDSYPVQA
ncbi:hypothetical protein SAMN05216525_11575 [Bradyrhizobium sp. Gha]|nr:hypothetical protein SAMN05216525_11575 [Bradyrhizobium sp. Gha]